LGFVDTDFIGAINRIEITRRTGRIAFIDLEIAEISVAKLSVAIVVAFTTVDFGSADANAVRAASIVLRAQRFVVARRIHGDRIHASFERAAIVRGALVLVVATHAAGVVAGLPCGALVPGIAIPIRRTTEHFAICSVVLGALVSVVTERRAECAARALQVAVTADADAVDQDASMLLDLVLRDRNRMEVVRISGWDVADLRFGRGSRGRLL